MSWPDIFIQARFANPHTVIALRKPDGETKGLCCDPHDENNQNRNESLQIKTN